MPLSMSKKLENRVAIITGANSGMGLLPRNYSSRKVCMSSSPAAAKRLDNALEEIGKNITGVQGNASNLADLDRLFETVKKEKCHINILFFERGFL